MNSWILVGVMVSMAVLAAALVGASCPFTSGRTLIYTHGGIIINGPTVNATAAVPIAIGAPLLLNDTNIYGGWLLIGGVWKKVATEEEVIARWLHWVQTREVS